MNFMSNSALSNECRYKGKADLRTPQLADYQTIASWIPNAESCLLWAGPRLPFPFSVAELPQLLTAYEERSYCLAEGKASPLGFGQHRTSQPNTVHLCRIIIAPSARGQGLGRLLCQLLMAQATQAGAKQITLGVFRVNAAAVTLYSSLGFTTVESKSNNESIFMQINLK